MNDAPAGAISAQCRDDPADALDAAERLAVLQAKPLHAQQDVIGTGDLGVTENLVLDLFGVPVPEHMDGRVLSIGEEEGTPAEPSAPARQPSPQVA